MWGEKARFSKEATAAKELFQQLKTGRYYNGKSLDESDQENFVKAGRTICVYVATADGSISSAEADLTNYLLGQNDSAQMLNDWQGYITKFSLVEQTVTALCVLIRMFSIIASNSTEKGYSAADDKIVPLVAAWGQQIMRAGNRVDPRAAQRLGEVLSRLKAAALEEERNRIADRAAARNSSVASASPAGQSDSGDPLAELHELIGLDSVKVEVETLANLAKVFTLRRQKNLPVPEFSFHLVFSGNPGTGKTTVARIVARIYKQLGLLTHGHLVEVDRSGLVANYVGQTATKVTEVIGRALGGVLFIDEAYALASGDKNDFGQEAIETLLKAMEDHRDDLIVIVAGYTDKMIGFLKSNPGLKSRFPKTIQFPDYSPEEMVEIFDKLCTDANYTIDGDASDAVKSCLQHYWDVRTSDFANARDVRNLFEAAIAAQANRLGTLGTISDQQLTTLTRADILATQGPAAPA